ncbi:FAD-dependent oxidoreductase [Amycolatopsis japonica]
MTIAVPLLPRKAQIGRRDHAVVVGGGIAGLLTARALANHFTRVTLLERDRFPETPRPRAGTPQSRHLHVLWKRGLLAAEQLLPGLSAELREAGAQVMRFPAEMAWLRATGWRGRFDVTELITAGRGVLDWTVRKRVEGTAAVTVLTSREAVGLLPDESGKQVVGVRFRLKGSKLEEDLPADLVVDASGRSSAAPKWLAELGYPAPEEIRIDSGLGYATRYFEIPEGFQANWTGLNISTNPRVNRRMGWLYPQENDRWVVCLCGVNGDYPPTDEAGFLEYARSLRSPVLYEAIRDAVPVSPIAGYRQMANHRRFYERMAHWPSGFVVIGDAAAAFNPVYAQGMTIAALSALALDRCLRSERHPARLARKTQRAVAREVVGAWTLATNEDLRYPATEGATPGLRTRLINKYVAKCDVVANVDRVVCEHLVEVLTLNAPLRTLFKPAVLARVLTHKPTPQPREVDGLTWSDTQEAVTTP